MNQREEVAWLFVCQPRWDPLPILPHSTLLRPLHPPGPAASTRSTTPAERSAQGRPSADVSAEFVCVCTRGCGWNALARIYVRRAYVLHLTNITSMYSALPYVAGYVANT